MWIGLFFLVFSATDVFATEVVDDTDSRVVLDKPAKRIVTLAPHLTEMVFSAGAGEFLIGTVNYSDYPEKAKAIPRVGSYKSWDMEKILSLKPDLVLAWLSGNGIAAIEHLRRLGLTVYVSQPESFSDIAENIREIAVLAATTTKSEEPVRQFEEGIRKLQQDYAGRKPVRLFYQIWQKPLMTINGRQMINRVFELCGGENVFQNLPGLAPVITREALLLADPEVLIGGARTADKRIWLQEWNTLGALAAVRKKQLYFVNPDILNRHTLRMLEGARQVCRILDEVRKETGHHD